MHGSIGLLYRFRFRKLCARKYAQAGMCTLKVLWGMARSHYRLPSYRRTVLWTDVRNELSWRIGCLTVTHVTNP